MSNIALSIRNLGKSYQIVHRSRDVGKYRKFSDVLINAAKRFTPFAKNRKSLETRETFWALEDISFDIRQGEQIGIIGRNGAGKSTLLKIVSRITTPTRGRIVINGRVSSLLEVGTGFHPELTGRENIFLNGAVLGMSRADIRQRFDAIVDFSEVERFLDTPVKHYSSGMYMRLAFAVAAHLEPDILIVDEVLAVGDATFQKKCLGKMKEVGSQGQTVLFVSHNMGAISEFCSRAILLEKGNISADGSPRDVIPLYSGKDANGSNGIVTIPLLNNEARCHIHEIKFLGLEGSPSSVFEISDAISIHIDYTVTVPLSELQITATISRDGTELFHAFDNDDEPDLLPTMPGQYRAIYTLPRRILKEGRYAIRITAGLPTELLQDIDNGLIFDVENNAMSLMKKSFRSDRAGLLASPGRWIRQNLTDTESLHE